MFTIGSFVQHPLFKGVGIVMKIHKNAEGRNIFEVFWQSVNRNGFHSDSNLSLAIKQ